jgi:hypothetical protein
VRLKVLQNIKAGMLVFYTEKYNLRICRMGETPDGVAARDLKRGEFAEYNVMGNSMDIFKENEILELCSKEWIALINKRKEQR